MERRRAWLGLALIAMAGAASWRASGDASVPGAGKPRADDARAPDWPGIDLCAAERMPIPDGGDRRYLLPGGIGPTFDEAIKLYDREDYHAAVPLFWSVARGRTGDPEDVRHRAAFFVGKSLFKLRLYLPSLSCFRHGATAPDAGSYRWKTLQWLESIASMTPEESGWGDLVVAYPAASVEHPLVEPVRDLLALRAALAILRRGGDAATALGWLTLVKEGDAALALPAYQDMAALAAANAAQCDFQAAAKHLAAFRARRPKQPVKFEAATRYRDEIRRERDEIKMLEPLMKGTDLLIHLQQDLTAREQRAEADTARRVERDRAQRAALDSFENAIERLIADGKAGRTEAVARAGAKCPKVP